MGFSVKTSKISSVVAVLCILTYIVAISFGIIRIVTNMGERRNLAETEFNDLAERATSSSVYLGFMSEAYQQAIRDYLNVSQTLSGAIITGTYGEYAFERQAGDTITWINGSPRFKTGLVFSGGPLYLPLRIDGQRNVTIQAVYSYIDYNLFQGTLKNVLLIILAALVVALITLILEIFLKNKTKQSEIFETSEGENFMSEVQENEVPDASFFEEPVWDEPNENENQNDRGNDFGISDFEANDSEIDDPEIDDLEIGEPLESEALGDEVPELYSPRGNIGWESSTAEKLASELQRCASSGQDLVFMAIEWRNTDISDRQYSRFANEAAAFFKMRDLVFEKGDYGISAVIPNTDLEQGISQANEFRRRIAAKMPELSEENLRAGLSARSGRPIDTDRLMLETFSALKKALVDPSSCVIAFKSDPEKYREFIKDRG